MRKVTDIVCACCPNACVVSVDETNNNAVSGNRCSNGEAYAIHELTNPKRKINAEVRVSGAATDRVKVKTDQMVPLETLKNIADVLQELVVPAPIYVSQVLLRDIAGTGANLIACQSIAKIEKADEE